ncbi:MAG: hypothetical protein KIH09_07235, partial [Candidatus Freyarchaeota archaeon]|nr:hypothetical protein [Candidatus Jordarchaeia archaeon]
LSGFIPFIRVVLLHHFFPQPHKKRYKKQDQPEKTQFIRIYRHGRMSYGDPSLRIPPWNLANAQRAKEALSYARESVEIAKKFIERWFSVEPK